MAGAVGQALERPIAAEAEVFLAGAADGPAASFLTEFKQGTVLFAVDGWVIFGRFCLAKQLSQHPVLQPRHGFRTAPAAVVPLWFGGFFAGQIEARELADHGVAAHPDFVGDLATGEPGREMVLEVFDALGGPGVVGHLKVPKHEPSLRLSIGLTVADPSRTLRLTESFRYRGSKAARP